MKHKLHKNDKKRNCTSSSSGDDGLSVSLDEIVDYAKNIDDQKEAERLELMCYRMFGCRLTPEAASRIAEIPNSFKKKCSPAVKKVITIFKGDKVDKKNFIPKVGNYNENVQEQNNNYPLPQICDKRTFKLAK